MAWGVFNKIAQGVKKGVDFVSNTVMPVARKVIDTVKPILSGTKFGKIIEKSDDILSYGEDIKNKYGLTESNPLSKAYGGKLNAIYGKPTREIPEETRKKIYNANKLMKPEFEDDEDDDDFE